MSLSEESNRDGRGSKTPHLLFYSGSIKVNELSRPDLGAIALVTKAAIPPLLSTKAFTVASMQIAVEAFHHHFKEINIESDGRGLEKLVGDLPETDPNRGKTAGRPAAHVIGRIEKYVSQNTLRWEPKAGRAFIEGGVVYRDGGLQVNETGLYHIYSRVQFEANHCTPTDALVHSVFVRRLGNLKSLTLMEGHREGYCNLGSHGHVWTSGSYLGSTLKLEKQDWLYVNVSHPAMLSHSHHANFFGLHKI
uniref:Fas ligand (TNF superfamily, member 6) n=1 Tax=Hucho hucho TaxID=62062 RepID=A0A4W5NRD7_9TELE